MNSPPCVASFVSLPSKNAAKVSTITSVKGSASASFWIFASTSFG